MISPPRLPSPFFPNNSHPQAHNKQKKSIIIIIYPQKKRKEEQGEEEKKSGNGKGENSFRASGGRHIYTYIYYYGGKHTYGKYIHTFTFLHTYPTTIS